MMIQCLCGKGSTCSVLCCIATYFTPKYQLAWLLIVSLRVVKCEDWPLTSSLLCDETRAQAYPAGSRGGHSRWDLREATYVTDNHLLT